MSSARRSAGLAVSIGLGALLLTATSACSAGHASHPNSSPPTTAVTTPSTITPSTSHVTTAPVTFPVTGLKATAATAAQPSVAIPVKVASTSHSSSLVGADLVYVTFPTQSTTRGLGIFQSATSATVGLVTSTRPVDQKILPVTNAGLAYAGGPSGYIKRLDAEKIPQLTYVVSPSSFHRSSSGALSVTLATARQMNGLHPPRRGLVNIDPTAKPSTAARVVTIQVPGRAPYRLTWSPTAKVWTGTVGGLELRATNVVVQVAPYASVVIPHSGKVTEENPDLFGRGTSVALPAGRVVPGAWSRTGPQAVTGYVDRAQHAVPFAPGKTWVIVAPSGSKVT